MGRILGGDFGFIEADAVDVVSLIWPTVVCNCIWILAVKILDQLIKLQILPKNSSRFIIELVSVPSWSCPQMPMMRNSNWKRTSNLTLVTKRSIHWVTVSAKVCILFGLDCNVYLHTFVEFQINVFLNGIHFKDPNFIDCQNWDMDYMRNCTPVDCEERYFGQMSYYNETTERCEEVAQCTGKNEVILENLNCNLISIVVHGWEDLI